MSITENLLADFPTQDEAMTEQDFREKELRDQRDAYPTPSSRASLRCRSKGKCHDNRSQYGRRGAAPVQEILCPGFGTAEWPQPDGCHSQRLRGSTEKGFPRSILGS